MEELKKDQIVYHITSSQKMIVSDDNDNEEVPVHWVDANGIPHDKIYPRKELTPKDPFLPPFPIL